MTLNTIKSSIAVVWVLGIAAVGVFTGITTVAGWLVLAGAAILPAFAMMRYWNEPAPTMSQSIRQAQR